ncbi:hypothetical protein RBG61_11685 [Paludicola sp. MB14-C6]|uniref:hypothetical protein n=1 Tax=Paludihabitans sp. MB14-C6 TaxID=3070656 RepID=UPI0027DDBAA1|nr:hypothetical protein [Paludicola sp. MB14-C6]WMJ22643.1 hypothetical protein RBG61_11685 [Paludicola sp. MB14-C6]
MKCKSILKLEFKRILTQKNIYALIVILTLWGAINEFFILSSFYPQNTESFENPAFLAMGFLNSGNSNWRVIITFIIPLLLSFFIGSFFLDDREKGRYQVLLTKSGKRIYWSQGIAILISTFFCVIIPCILEHIILYISFPSKTYICLNYGESIQNLPLISSLTCFSYLYKNHPYLLNIICIGMYGIYCATLALLFYSISLLMPSKINKNIVLLFIAAAFIFINVVFSFILYDYFPVATFIFSIGNAVDFHWYLFFILFELVISLVIITCKTRRKGDIL